MAELTPSSREAARGLGVSDTALHKAERAGRIAREPDGSWDIDKTRRRLTETADPTRSSLASGGSAEGTPFARLTVAPRALMLEALRLSLEASKRRLLEVTQANAALDEIGSAMRDALRTWPVPAADGPGTGARAPVPCCSINRMAARAAAIPGTSLSRASSARSAPPSAPAQPPAPHRRASPP
jgi:hypothetical protein